MPKVDIGTAKRIERKEEKPKIKIDFKPNPKDKEKAEKWDKSVLGKIGRFVGSASAPLADVQETAEWIASRGKKKTGGPLGYTRKTLRDLGMGKKTEKTIQRVNKTGDLSAAIERRLKKGPVDGVAIRRKANDPHGKYVADF